MSVPARIKYIGLSLLFVVATVNFTKTTLSILESSKRLDVTKNEVLSLQKKREELERDLAYKKTDEFVEETARNELNLIKPREQVFIVPEVLSKGVESIRTIERTTQTSSVQKWLDLFF